MNSSSLRDKIEYYSKNSYKKVMEDLETGYGGKTKKEVEISRNKYGANKINTQKKDTYIYRLRRSFVNPFSIVLLIIAIISLFTDIIFKECEKRNYITVITISVMILVSGVVRLIQEMNAKRVTDKLTEITDTMVKVKRNGELTYVECEEIVVGDLVILKAGDRVPADMRVIFANDCFVSESGISGESGFCEKTSDIATGKLKSIVDFKNIVFKGTTIISGQLEAIVVAVGKNTIYGGIVPEKREKDKKFDKGANAIALVLIKFMVILVPVVFLAGGITKGDWLTAFLFALSVAIGLTPELLPMVVTACLAKGSYNMANNQTIVKNVNAMQGFGNMDILCVDKTGTLTEDSLKLEYYMDVIGNECKKTLNYAFLNSFYHSGVKNHIDNAILDVKNQSLNGEYYDNLTKEYKKIDELPFDYSRKIASVLLEKGEKYFIISKGNIDNIVAHCKFVEYKGRKIEIFGSGQESVHAVVDEMLSDGMKVMAIAFKETCKKELTLDDEEELTLLGFIAFFDAPKKSALSAIEKLKNLNINIKVLTGDNMKVALSVCKRLNIPTEQVMTGEEFDALNDNETQIKVESTNLFVELSPKQKSDIVGILQSNGHSVGFLGDGMNDLPAVVRADVGISVDTALPTLKEGADVILLKKDLDILERGVKEGRKSFANMTKYVKITASSNLGNILSIVIASIFLPFFPVTTVQILLLNLLYDIICLVIPWDRVDDELIQQPLEWSGKNLGRFMMSFGPISSIFDIITFAFLYFIFCPWMCGGMYFSLSYEIQLKFISLFQTGWFLESMWTQVLILYLLRSKKLPFVKTQPSLPVILVTLVGIVIVTLLTMTPLGEIMGLMKLPPLYFVFLFFIVIIYLLVVTIVKKMYVKIYDKLL